MIRSMTGYGKAEVTTEKFYVKVEMRSLNSKFFDLNLRCPSQFRDKEMVLRNFLSEKLQRGKVDVQVVFESVGAVQSFSINKKLIQTYVKDLKSALPDALINMDTLLSIAMKMPDVISTAKDENFEKEWETVIEVSQKAIDEFNNFRENEGKELRKDFEARVKTILNLIVEAEKFEGERMETIKTRMRNGLTEAGSGKQFDENRFEQELIYYIERMDFSEEKQRLRTHCDFFMKTTGENDSNGRKLNFISQEMGREINTLGSKANHAEIQKLVVQMKDELEKIKEQLLNVL